MTPQVGDLIGTGDRIACVWDVEDEGDDLFSVDWITADWETGVDVIAEADYWPLRAGDTYATSDAAALDRLAEFVRLPVWQVRGSCADWIEAVAEIVSSRRDCSVPASDAFRSEWDDDYEEADDDEPEGACPEDPDGLHFSGCGCE